MSDTIEITRAATSDAPEVAELIATAFHDLEVAQWLVPDPEQRAQILPANFRIWVDHALAHGQVQLTVDRLGVAVWFPRNPETPLPEPVGYSQRLAAACGEATPRFQHLDNLFDKHHPRMQPHHHLAFLAVHPQRQRQGVGAALLQRHHSRIDAFGVGAYLEATSPGSKDLYEQHGYRQLHQNFWLPDGTPIWPMWRPPARIRRQNGDV